RLRLSQGETIPEPRTLYKQGRDGMVLTRISVHIHGDKIKVFEAYDMGMGIGWNVTPCFTLEVAREVIQHVNTLTLQNQQPNIPLEGEGSLKPISVETEDGVKQLYPIGAWAWCWVKSI